MSMPQIPEGTHRPTIDETIIDLLESIALEEIAISHILNAEGEKLQEILKKYACKTIDFCDVLEGSKSIRDMVNTLIMKEWLLYNKLNTVISISYKTNENTEILKNCTQFTPKTNENNKYCDKKQNICESCIHYEVCNLKRKCNNN